LLPRVKNIPNWLRKAKEPHWCERDQLISKYIDDGLQALMINMKKENTYEMDGKLYREAFPCEMQAMFNHMVARAEGVGMVVNQSKTKVMCVSAATSYEARVGLVVDSSGRKAENVGEMKVLGVTLDRKLSFDPHVESVVRALRKRLWAIKELARAGFSEQELLKFYQTMIRPVGEYACAAWGPMLTAEQSEKIEKQQNLSLKLIYGFDLSAKKLREKSGLKSLEERRKDLTMKFAQKASTNERYTGWFKRREEAQYEKREGTMYNSFVEYNCKTQRCFNSPLYTMRRMLNGHY